MMLKLLDCTHINKMIFILFDLLTKNRRLTEYSKFIGLTVKCILKLTKTLNNKI